ncbi:hypothetical protein EVG20_g9717, partial [Dentipellis fragilis]
TTCPPHFIHVHDPLAPRATAALLTHALTTLASFPPSAFPDTRLDSDSGSDADTDTGSEPQQQQQLLPHIAAAHIDAVACFTPRLFFDTALNGLARWRPRWEDGARCWGAEDGAERYNDGVDGFMHGLRALRTELARREMLVEEEREKEASGSGKGKGKSPTKPRGGARGRGRGRGGGGRAQERERAVLEKHESAVRMVLVVERAERLRDTLPDLLVPLTRLAELSRVDITTIFLSQVNWDDLKPALGASPDPYRMVIPPPSKQATLEALIASYPPPLPASSHLHPLTYHPSLQPLYAHFLQTLQSVCAPFAPDPAELAYIAAARWPGFVKPVIDAHLASLAHAHEGTDDGEEGEEDFSAALDALYPRLTNAAAWARAQAAIEEGPVSAPASSSFTSLAKGKAREMPGDRERAMEKAAVEALPRMARFVLVAAYLASTNPPKTDVRMFARGRDDSRKKRKGGGTRKPRAKASDGAAKVAQRLLGPLPFPLDRLLAVLAILLEEYDLDTREVDPEMSLPGEYTEMEVGRVHVYGTIVELASLRLLQRTSPPDRIDGPPMFKCGVGYELALALARDLGVPMLDLMWEAVIPRSPVSRFMLGSRICIRTRAKTWATSHRGTHGLLGKEAAARASNQSFKLEDCFHESSYPNGSATRGKHKRLTHGAHVTRHASQEATPTSQSSLTTCRPRIYTPPHHARLSTLLSSRVSLDACPPRTRAMSSRATRLAALSLSFAFGVIGGSVGLNGLIKRRIADADWWPQGKPDKVASQAHRARRRTVDINTNDVFKSGVVVTTVAALIAVLSLVGLLATFSAPPRLARPQAFLLAFCALWLFAAVIPFDVFFANNSAKVTAFLNGVQLPPQAVQAVQSQLGVSSRYKDMHYLRLVAIIPWFTILFTAIAAGVLLASSREPAGAYATSTNAPASVAMSEKEKEAVQADTKDVKDGADADVKNV